MPTFHNAAGELDAKPFNAETPGETPINKGGLPTHHVCFGNTCVSLALTLNDQNQCDAAFSDRTECNPVTPSIYGLYLSGRLTLTAMESLLYYRICNRLPDA